MFVVQMDIDLIRDIEMLKQFRIIKRDVELASRMGVDKSTISNLLSGRRPPSKEFTEKFYEVFKNEIELMKNTSTSQRIADFGFNADQNQKETVQKLQEQVESLKNEISQLKTMLLEHLLKKPKS